MPLRKSEIVTSAAEVPNTQLETRKVEPSNHLNVQTGARLHNASKNSLIEQVQTRLSLERANEACGLSSISSLDEIEETYLNPGELELNRRCIVPAIFGVVSWVLVSGAILFFGIFLHQYSDVSAYEEMAVGSAVAHLRFEIAELLAGATTLVRGIEAAFRSGRITAPAAYGDLLTLVVPHFQATRILREIQIADGNGSISIAPNPRVDGSMLLWSERDDCWKAQLAFVGGCIEVPVRAPQSNWYNRVRKSLPSDFWYYPLRSFWEGLVWESDTPDEIANVNLAYTPTIAFVGQLGWNAPWQDNYTVSSGYPVTTVVARASIDTRHLQESVRRAEALSNAEVFLLNSRGELLVATDWQAVFLLDPDESRVRPRYIWELERPWAQFVYGDFVLESPASPLRAGDVRVTSHRLETLSNATEGLAASMRILVALPGGAFSDPILGRVGTFGLVVGAFPTGMIALASLLTAYFRYCRVEQVDS